MIILVYPFIFTGEELRYDYGFPHAEWRRNPQAPGTKSNIDNIEAADSKNKISRNVDEPFITVTRKKKLETLFKQSGPEKEKPGDSEKRISSTTQRKGEESEVPVKEVSNLYPNLSAKNLTIPLQPVPLQSCNESNNIEIQNAADTVEKPPNTLHNNAGDTEPRISTKSSQNKSSKNEKNKTTDTEEKALNPLRKDGDTEPRISTKSSQNQSSNVEKNKTTDTEAKASKQPRKPKNVTRSIEASYAKMTELEGRKPKTPFGAKNECIIPQKVSTISLITRLRFEITDFLKNLFLVAFAPQSENNLMAFMHLIH